MDVWLKSAFMLNFKTSFELDRFSQSANERIFQSPLTANGPTSIYVRFAAPLTEVLRMTVVYRCPRQVQLDSTRDCFLSHTIDQ